MANFINEDIIIDFEVPAIIEEMMDLAEEEDRKNNLGGYIVYSEQIDVLAKNCCAAGKLTMKMWDTLNARYPG